MIPLRAACCVLLVLLGLALNVALAGEPLFSDDFRDLKNWDITSTLNIGSKSAPKGPRWMLADGWLRPVKVPDLKEGEEVYHVALAKWDSPADCTVRCKVRRRPGQGAHGVVFRAKDPDNCLAARITTLETIELVQFANGKEHVLASVNGYLPPGESTIEVRAYGPRVSIVLNGMEMLSYDKAPVGRGRCGLFSASSADLDFGRFSIWEKVPPIETATPRVLKKAYLLSVTRDSARILWETLTPMEGSVAYHPTESEHDMQLSGDSSRTTMHDITIKGLKPGTKYSFTANSGNLSAGEGSFTTDPGPGVPFRVGVLSDTHFGDFTKAVTERLAAHHPQIVIHAGDSINDGRVADEWEMDYFGPAAKLLANVPVYVASGNHDAPGFYWSRRYFPYAQGTDQGARYFAFQYGSAYFIVLTHYDTPMTSGSPQYTWLVEQLQSPAWAAARWRIVYYHQPPYSAGWKDWTTGGDLDIRRHVLPLLEKHGATMVLSGHTHSHERGYLNGVIHIINGSIGIGEDWGRNWPFVQYHRIVPHFSVMDVSDDTLTFTAYDMNDKVLDRFVLEHGKPFDLAVGPTVVKGPVDGTVGRQQVTLRCPELGAAAVRYRVVLDERRSEDGFWAPSEETFPANQEAKLWVQFPVPGRFTVKCQVLTADMLRPGKWVEAGVVNIGPKDALPAPPKGRVWKLIWHDEFDGTKLDENKWQSDEEGKRHDGWWSREAVSLDGKGRLVIETKKEGERYFDACVTTRGKFEHAFGFYVARIQLQKQQGHWPGFWLYGPGVGKVGNEGRDGTEIDIMEKPTLDDRVEHNLHWDDCGKDHKREGTVVRVPGVMEGFHTFAVWWKPDEYVFYIDGKETWRTSAGGVCQVPQYILLSDEIAPWVGDIRKAKLPDRLLVDYVRVYDLADK